MKLLRLNKAPAAIVSELTTMAPMKYKICYFLNWNDVGYNVVASKRVFSTLRRVSQDYQGLLLPRHGNRLTTSRSLPSSSFQSSQFSTSHLPAQKGKKKLAVPRAAGTSLQDLFKQDLQSSSPFNVDPSYVAFSLQIFSEIHTSIWTLILLEF